MNGQYDALVSSRQIELARTQAGVKGGGGQGFQTASS
jgi:hypothetical protein